MESFGRILVLVGISIFFLGLAFIIGSRFFPWLGKLPGDIHIQRGNLSCFFPLATMIILSIILTIVLNFVIRVLNK